MDIHLWITHAYQNIILLKNNKKLSNNEKIEKNK